MRTNNSMRLCVFIAGAVAMLQPRPMAHAQCPSGQQAHLFASDGAEHDTLGHSVAIEGTTIVVGSHNDDTPAGQQAGSAYVYELINGIWVEQAHLFASDATSGDSFGFCVAISGETIVVGAPVNGPGSAYIFVRSGGVWTQHGQLFASDGVNGDDFGFGLAISGDTIIVGAREDHVGGLEEVGSAYVFVRSNGAWSEQAHIFAEDPPEYGTFARAVAIDGNTAVLGPMGNAALVFVRNGNVWSQQAVLFAPGGIPGDGFGNSVAIDGDTIVIGADRDATAGGNGAGSAAVFVRSGNSWFWQAQLLASDGAANDFFGTSVGISGDTVVVGSFFDNTAAGTDAGSAYVYKRSGTLWTQQAHLFASDDEANDYFGAGVAIWGGKVVVGTYADDTIDGMNAGSAYVFSLGLGGSGDINGDGDIDSYDAETLAAVLTGFNTNPADVARADVDCSGSVDGGDIQPFVEASL